MLKLPRVPWTTEAVARLDEEIAPRCADCGTQYIVDAYPVRFRADGTKVRAKVCRACRRARKIGKPTQHRCAELLREFREQPCRSCGQQVPTAAKTIVPPPDLGFRVTSDAGRVSEARLKDGIRRSYIECRNCASVRIYNARQLNKKAKPTIVKVKTTMIEKALADLAKPPFQPNFQSDNEDSGPLCLTAGGVGEGIEQRGPTDPDGIRHNKYCRS